MTDHLTTTDTVVEPQHETRFPAGAGGRCFSPIPSRGKRVYVLSLTVIIRAKWTGPAMDPLKEAPLADRYIRYDITTLAPDFKPPTSSSFYSHCHGNAQRTLLSHPTIKFAQHVNSKSTLSNSFEIHFIPTSKHRCPEPLSSNQRRGHATRPGCVLLARCASTP